MAAVRWPGQRECEPSPKYELREEVRVFGADLTGFVIGIEHHDRGLQSDHIVYIVRWWTGSEVQPVSRMTEDDLVHPWRSREEGRTVDQSLTFTARVERASLLVWDITLLHDPALPRGEDGVIDMTGSRIVGRVGELSQAMTRRGAERVARRRVRKAYRLLNEPDDSFVVGAS